MARSGERLLSTIAGRKRFGRPAMVRGVLTEPGQTVTGPVFLCESDAVVGAAAVAVGKCRGMAVWAAVVVASGPRAGAVARFV